MKLSEDLTCAALVELVKGLDGAKKGEFDDMVE